MEETGHTSNDFREKRGFKISANVSSVETLRQLSQSLPREDQKLFVKKYGAIMDLLFIPVEVSALSALAQYWNTYLRCFELPDLDISPTIEEYSCMLGLSLKKDTTVYFHREYHLADIKIMEQFGQLLGIPASQIRLTGHTDSRGISRAFLENRLRDLERQQQWSVFSRVLALTIYGLILFPSALDMIDHAAMDVFFMVETKNRNPVPAVLAETFLSLDFCHQKKKGKLRCCVHLLYVWIITHMYAGNHINSSSDPLKSIQRIPVKQMNENEWKLEFDSMDVRSFKWVCPWYESKRGEIIYSCGNFPNIPLMGPRGCISYTPALVLRQLCWTQKVPREEQIGGCCFRYKDGDHTKQLSKEVIEAWRDIRMAGRAELGKPLVIHTHSYVAWREARVRPENARRAVPREETHSLSMSQLEEQIEVMKAQMQFLEQQKENMELEMVIARSQCEKKDKIIERLKDELADAAEVSNKRKGKEKVSENLLFKLQKLEEKVLSLSKEKCELKEKINRQEKTEENLIIEVNKQRRAKEQLEGEIYDQFQARADLEQKVEELTILLEKVHIDREQGWRSYEKCHDALVEASKAGGMWKNQALDWKAEAEESKDKYAKITSELSHYAPNFVRRFEKADKRIHTDLTLHLPPEVDDFMEMCGGLARGLKRKKIGLLM